MTESAADELVEWVDERGEVLEVVTRRRMRAENLRHRSVSIIVTSSDGRLLVHRRADTKDLLPGWWDVVAGGVLAVGESFEDAARRELAEELGIDDVAPVKVGSGTYDGEQSREICELFRVTHDGPYDFADGEVAEARLVTPAQYLRLRSEAPFVPGSLELARPHLGPFGPG